MIGKFYLLCRFFFPVALLSILFSSCIEVGVDENVAKNSINNFRTVIEQSEIDNVTASGENLSKIYCGSCHLFPAPELLTKKVWKENVLPNMAYRLGLRTSSASPMRRLSYEEQALLLKADVYSQKQLIDSTAWNKILDYYLSNAPDSAQLTERFRAPLTSQFELENFYADPQDYPLVTMVKFDQLNGQVIAGDAFNNVKSFDYEGNLTHSMQVKSPPIGFKRDHQSFKLLTIGPMTPSNAMTGQVVSIKDNELKKILVDSLPRSVDIDFADFNDDGREDILVCGFGHDVGALTWHENMGNGEYKKHLLSSDPGAIVAHVLDYNNDGNKDIMVLMAQGMERIDLYTGDGVGNFTMKTLKSFPPVYGSLYFELKDIDNDEDLDLIYVNGDNADYSVVPKNFHGIRIYLNDGGWNFKLSQFLPMYGAIKTIARDFDQDNDVDIMAISFFPEYALAPGEGIVYFENNTGNFNRYSIENDHVGHWMVMDAGDIDEDGDEDILIGSFLYGVNAPDTLETLWKQQSRNIVVLKNRLFDQPLALDNLSSKNQK